MTYFSSPFRDCTLLLLLACSLLAAPSCYGAERVALVIGNGEYQASPLKNPVNDANDITEMLSQLNFDVITRINANKKQMISAIDTFARKLRQADIGLFFYAGHGMQIRGQNYLIPVSVNVSSESDVEFEAVNAGRVIGKMRKSENKLNVVILDACRNNPFKRNFRSTEQGLARMDAPVGTIIAYATGPGNVAGDGLGRNGIYTKNLLATMDKPGLDIQNIFNEAGMGVMQDTGNQQIPWTSNTPIPRYYLAGGTPNNVMLPSPGSTPGDEKSSLSVTSDPSGAKVHINFQIAGETPLQLSNMNAGTVIISVVKDGLLAKKKKVILAPGQKTATHFELKAREMKGWLTVKTSPSFAKIRLVNIGSVNHSPLKLKARSYQIKVSATGYITQKRWVTVKAGAESQEQFTLKKKKTSEEKTRRQNTPIDLPYDKYVNCILPGERNSVVLKAGSCVSYKGTIQSAVSSDSPSSSVNKQYRVSTKQTDVYVRCLRRGDTQPVYMKAGSCVKEKGKIVSSPSSKNFSSTNYTPAQALNYSSDDYVRCLRQGDSQAVYMKAGSCLKENGKILSVEKSRSYKGSRPGCFIATAAFGSPQEKHVATLRNFRDRWLASSHFGRNLIEMYYIYSPPIATIIAENVYLKTITRLVLIPVAVLAGVFLFNPGDMVLVLVSLLLLSLMLARAVRKSQCRGKGIR